MIIGSNFKLSSRKFLDARQQCESLAILEANELKKLYPYGFEVFCIEEGKWYQNVSNNGTPAWEERSGGSNNIDINDIIEDEEILNNKTWSSAYIYDLQNNLEQLITDNEDYITEIEDRLIFVEGELMLLEGYATKEYVDSFERIQSSVETPTDEKVTLWIDTSKNTEIISIARINDETISDTTVWSSEQVDKYISEKITQITSEIVETQEAKVQSEGYITKIDFDTMLEEKEYLTEHQNIDNLVTKDEIHSHTNEDIINNITEDMVISWNNKSEFSGNYNDLTNKPNIPDIEGLATESYIDEKINKITIPTKLSQLTNDSNFINAIPNECITKNELNAMGYLTEHQDISYLATRMELNAKADVDVIPTKLSQLTNDSNFISTIPSEYITKNELNTMGYLTNDSIKDVATRDELFSKNYNDLINKPVIPTKLSQLTNDSNFINSIPNEYITETELNAMNYATISQIPTSLPANGGNSDTVCGFSIWVGTQLQYDAIEIKNPTTIYLIHK